MFAGVSSIVFTSTEFEIGYKIVKSSKPRVKTNFLRDYYSVPPGCKQTWCAMLNKRFFFSSAVYISVFKIMAKSIYSVF